MDRKQDIFKVGRHVHKPHATQNVQDPPNIRSNQMSGIS